MNHEKDVELRIDEMDLSKPAPTLEPERQYYFIKKARALVAARAAARNAPLTYCVTTFGCQMNSRDSEKLIGILKQVGYSEEPDEEKADFVIFNTCTVRENANDRVYGRLGALKHAKKQREDMMIGLCGCMMQDSTVIDKLKKSYRYVDLIFGTHNIYKFAELLVAQFETGDMVIDIWEDTDQIVEDLPSERKYSFKAGVNIMFGCNNFCSYCIVPYVRGRERSRNAEDILKEIENLAADGVVEVMLLGQNVNSYQNPEISKNPETIKNPEANDEETFGFAELLTAIEKIDGIKRIRFMTSHPKDLSDEVIAVMGASKKICTHLHLPIQSGSTRILEAMNRGYSKEDYLTLVEKVKKAVPGISLTTDIIVGFPGETEEDFLETIDVVRRVRYDSAFTFIYSKRTGTPAAVLTDDTPEEVVKERFNRLLKEIHEISREVTAVHEGTIQGVVVESLNEKNHELLTGRLSNNLLVHFPGDANLIGQIKKVELETNKGFYYLGSLVES